MDKKPMLIRFIIVSMFGLFGVAWGIVSFIISRFGLDCNHLYFTLSSPLWMISFISLAPAWLSAAIVCNADLLNYGNIFGVSFLNRDFFLGFFSLLFGLVIGLVVGGVASRLFK